MEMNTDQKMMKMDLNQIIYGQAKNFLHFYKKNMDLKMYGKK